MYHTKKSYKGNVKTPTIVHVLFLKLWHVFLGEDPQRRAL